MKIKKTFFLAAVLCAPIWAAQGLDLREAFGPYKQQSISIFNRSEKPVAFCVSSQFMFDLAPGARQRIGADTDFLLFPNPDRKDFGCKSVGESYNSTDNVRTIKFLQFTGVISLNPKEKKVVLVSSPSYIQGLFAEDEKCLPDLGWASLGDCIIVEFGPNRQKYLDWKTIGGRLQGVWTPAWSRNLFGMQDSDIETQCRRLMEISEETYFQDSPVFVNSIPHVHHRFWITDNHEAPPDRLEFFVETCRVLNQVKNDWQHFFWCVDPLKIPNTVSYLLTAGVGIQVRTVGEIQSILANHLIDAFLHARLFVFANDILRIKVAYEFGGLCCDIGVLLKPNMAPLIDRYNYIWWLWKNTFDFCVMGTRSQDPILGKYLSIVDRLYEMPPHLRSGSSWTAPPLLGSVLLFVSASSDEDLKMLFLSNGSHAENRNLGSWSLGSKVTKYGNVSSRDSGLDPYSIRPTRQGV